MDLRNEFTIERIAKRIDEAKESLAEKTTFLGIANKIKDSGLRPKSDEQVRKYAKGLAWQLSDPPYFLALADALQRDPLWLMFGLKDRQVSDLPNRAVLNDTEYRLLKDFQILPPPLQEKVLGYVRGMIDSMPESKNNVRPFRPKDKK